MLVSEIATRVKGQFGDSAGAQIADADIIRWINDAMLDIAINNNLLQMSATAAVVSGTQAYNFPANLLATRSLRWQGNKLQNLSMEEADALQIGNDTNIPTGVPSVFWEFARQFYLWPTPNVSDSTSLKVFYTRVPTTVTAVGDTPELPVQYHTRLVEYCIAQAMELDDNLAGYNYKIQQYKAGITDLRDNQFSEAIDTYPGITVTIRDMGDTFGGSLG